MMMNKHQQEKGEDMSDMTIAVPHEIGNLKTAEQFASMIPSWYERNGVEQPFTLTVFNSEEGWKEGRRGHIGASQVGTVLGLTDQWKTRRQLFDELTGKRIDEFKGNELTRFGQSAEPLIRALWAMEHPDWDVFDGTHMIFVSKAEPWRSCSLDFIAVHRTSGEIVIGEVKTGLYNSHWKGGQLPDNYLAQVCQQLDVTKFSGAVVVARLRLCGGGSATGGEGIDGTGRERAYYFDANDPAIQDNMRYVAAEVNDFWRGVCAGVFVPKINLAI